MYKRIRHVALITIFLSSILMTGIYTLPQVKGTTTTVKVEPESTTGLDVGDTFSINMTVNNVLDLYGWQFDLYYHSTVLNGSSVTEGPFLQAGGVSTFFVLTNFTDNYNATHGYIWFGCSRVGNVTGADGNGTLATITFKAKATGDSILHLVDTMLMDSAEPFGNLIPHTAIDGSAHVGLIDIAVINIATAINIPKDTMAYINVTAENQGELTETFDVTLHYEDNPVETKTVINLPAGAIQILAFTWDTTPISIGEYTLRAEATAVPGEEDTSDNTYETEVYVGTRDIAITNVVPSKTIAPKGCPIPIDVTVQNQGQATETFNVTVYYDSNIIETKILAQISGGSTTITFTWNTTAVDTGNHNITATASPLPYETDTTDNTLTGGTVNIVLPPDTAITNITNSKNVVCQGYSTPINVTVKNFGPLTETFNVTVYIDITPIQTLPVTLTSGDSTTVTFAWNTTGLAEYENYAISAHASLLPWEIYTEDNNFTDGLVLVVHVGDVIIDEKVRVDDILAVALKFGTNLGDPDWDPLCDINCDDKVRVDDILAAALEFGWSKP